MYIDLATINMAPGQVSPGGGSVTPEEQEALNTLVDASEGVLYTEEFESMSSKYIRYAVSSYFNINQVYDTGDGIYSFSNSEFCEFNKTTFQFDFIRRFNISYNELLWKDKTGRFYQGRSYILNFDNGQSTFINLGYPPIVKYFNNKGNIFYGQYAVWCIYDNNAYKFNEDTQKFVSATINVPVGVTGISETVCGKFKYKGHWLFYNNGNIYEIKEYEDHIDIVAVTGDYFNMPSFAMNWKYLFATTDGLYYFEQRNLYAYDETSGQWLTLDYMTVINGSYWNNTYVVFDDFCIGGRSNNDGKTYNITYLGNDDYTSTFWQKINNIAVDLTSTQEITGTKKFNTINAANIMYTGPLMYFNSDVEMHYDGKNRTVASSMNFEVPGLFTLNDIDIATVNDCIVNQTVSYPGPRFMGVLNWGDQYAYDYGYIFFYSTPGGRLIYINGIRRSALEFNGSQFVTLNTVTNFVSSNNRAVVGNDLYVVSNDLKLYKWDDVSGDFVYIVDAPNGDNIWAADTNTLRIGQYLYLVNNGGTYSWENDPHSVGFSTSIKSFIIGQITYVISNRTVFNWFESTGSASIVGQLSDSASDNHFVEYNGYIYYFGNNGQVRRIDVTKAGTDDFDVVSDIYWDSWNNPLEKYAGILYTIRNSDIEFGYNCNITSEVPDVPGSDGTYTLKAVRVGDQITYGWVLDV